MKERIQQVMDKKELSPSRFAEEIGIQRAAMSHILNGRNNPSLDVVTKILQRYPDVHSDWLLFGKGEMLGIAKAPFTYTQKESTSSGQNTLLFPDEETEVPEYRKEMESNHPPKPMEAPQIQQIKIVEKPSKKVVKIMLFYSDNTFDTFIPEEEATAKS